MYIKNNIPMIIIGKYIKKLFSRNKPVRNKTISNIMNDGFRGTIFLIDSI